MTQLAGSAADHTRELLVLSFPRNRWWIRLGLGAINGAMRLTRREFQVFLHSPDRIVASAEQRGLRSVWNDFGFV